MDLAVNNLSLFFSAMLVVGALILYTKEKVGFTKDIIISVIRAVIQLVAVGYLLKYVFQVNNLILTLIMVLVIVSNAAFNAKKRSQQLQKGFLISFIAIGCSTGITIGILIFSGSIKFIPSQIIPISGMIASNVMVAIGLAYRSLNTEFKDLRPQVLERLALGANLKQASQTLIVNAIKTGMAPTIDSAKTVGLVSLPGMMSGLIFAGIDPTKAIMYQIMVTFMLLGATSLGSFIAVYRSYPRFYNDQKQLR